MHDFRPQMVALDIDGTLVDHDGVASPATIAAVHRVVEAGVPVVLSTGRAWAGTSAAVELLQLPPGIAVTSNGAVVLRHQPLDLVHQVTFDPAPVVRRALELVPQAMVAVEDAEHGYRVNRAFPDGELGGTITVQHLDQLVGHEVSRVVIRDPESSVSDFEQLAASLGMHGVEYFVGWTAWLDIVPPGVSKATGLELVCRELGVHRADVLAVGDGNNDIEMLGWAGRGVAMGQAPAAVLASADAVTGSVADDGLAAELSRWF